MDNLTPEQILAFKELGEGFLYPLLAGFLLYIFREPLTSLIPRIKRLLISHKDSSFEMEASDTPAENMTQRLLATPVEKEDEVSGEVEDEAQEEPNLTQKLIASLEKKDFDEAGEVFEEYSSKEEDDKKLERNRGFYFFLKFEIGQQQSAIEELQEFSKNCIYETNKKLALSWLTIIYKETFQGDMIVSLWKEAVDEFKEEDNIVWSVCELSSALIDVGNNDLARTLVLGWLHRQNTPKNQAMLFKAMGDIEKSSNNLTNQVLCYDKALEIIPSDKDRLFDVAYLAGEHNLKEITRGNYKRLISLEPDNGDALNNYGVQAQNEKLNTIALHYYDQSIAFDSSLAMANRGYLLLDAGFIKEAEDIVKKAIKKFEEPHENIFSLKTDIEERKKAEKNKWKEIESKAISRQNLLRDYTEQYYIGNSKAFDKSWKTKAENEVEVFIDNNQITLSWKEYKGLAASTEVSITVSAKIEGATFNGRYTSKAENSGATLLTAGENKELACIGYVSKDGKKLRILSEYYDEKLDVVLSSQL